MEPLDRFTALNNTLLIFVCEEKSEKVSYQGDSGGPLTYKQSNGQHILIGEVSYGNSCALVGACNMRLRCLKLLR